MTPQIAYFATAVAPAINTVYAAVVVPELLSYLPANGSTIVTSGGAPIPGPIYRGIWSASGRLETSAGTFTTGAVGVYTLMPDGNWHAGSTALTLAASTNSFFSLGQGNSAGSFTFSFGLPALGLAFVFPTALTGGGTVNFMEIFALSDAIDPRYCAPLPYGAAVSYKADVGLSL